MSEQSELNLKQINKENKLRSLVSELITPLIMKVAEQELNTKEIQKNIRDMRIDLSIVEGDLRKLSEKVYPKEEVFTRIESLSTKHGKKIEETAFDLSRANLCIEKQMNLIADLTSKLNSFSSSQDFALTTIDGIHKQILEFKQKISLDNARSVMMCKEFIDAQDTFNSSTTQKINKISMRISEFNSKAFPELIKSVQDKNVEVVKIKEKLEELFGDRVVCSDLLKMKNKFEGDIIKITEKFKSDLEQINSFLDTMLRVEISCGISDTLFKVLDTRQIKRLIPVVENLIGNDTRLTFEANSPLSAGVRPVQTENLYTKTISQTKNLENSLENYKKRISLLESEQQKFIRKHSIKTPKIVRKQPPPPRVLVMEPQKDLLVSKAVNHPPPLLKFEDTLTKHEEFVPVHSIESQSRELEESYIKSSSESNDFEEQINQFREELKTIIQVRLDLEQFQSEIVEKLEGLRENIENVKKEFRTNFFIYSQEIELELKVRTKEIQENSAKIENLFKNFNNLDSGYKELDSKSNFFRNIIEKLIDGQKIVIELLSQDEEDKQSVHLAGLAEKKDTKSPTKSKQMINFKPDCLSCSGQSSLLYSAFKLACLNYYPSEVKYENKQYTRKELIKKVWLMLQNIFKPDAISEESIVSSIGEFVIRTKSAGKVKMSRQVFDASLTKSSIYESPKKLDLKIKKFNFH